MRNLFIENTMTKAAKEKMMQIGVEAAITHQPVNFVTTRSPEFLHAQIGMADPNLPRSTKSLIKFKEIVDKSAEFIPTTSSVFLADVAIDNLDKISQTGSVELLIIKNLAM